MMDNVHVLFTVAASGIIGWLLGCFAKALGPLSVIPLVITVVLFVATLLNIVYGV